MINEEEVELFKGSSQANVLGLSNLVWRVILSRRKAEPLLSYSISLTKTCTLLKEACLIYFSFLNTFILEISNCILKSI